MTIGATPSRAPVPLTPLIGREAELAQIGAQLADPAVRLVTITGPGGVGKTRLALGVAEAIGGYFPDGVESVSLATATAADDVLPAIAAALGVREDGDRPQLDNVIAWLAGKQLLLLLDNAEHVIAGVASLASILSGAPGLKALVTSQVALRLRGEREFALAPLALPAPNLSASDLEQSPGVQLFLALARIERARLVKSEDDLRAIAEIVWRLDGLPLAIELAAARAAMLPPRTMLGRLEKRLTLLTGGPRDLPERHQTLRAAVAWSYELLTPEQRALFGRLALLPGGAALSVVEALAEDGVDWPDALQSLIEHSLVRRVDDSCGEPRFTLLSTLREFGTEVVERTGRKAEIRARIGAHFVARAETAAGELAGPEQAQRLVWFELEHDNLRPCLDWSIEAGDVMTTERFAAALGRAWLIRGRLSEGRAQLRRALALDPSSTSKPRASALTAAGALAEEQGDHAGAMAAYEESLRISMAHGDEYGIARSVNNLGLVAMGQLDYDGARRNFQQALAMFRKLGNDPAVAVTLINLARVADRQGEADLAHGLLTRALTVQRRLGDEQRIALTLQTLAIVQTARGELEKADRNFIEAISRWETIGDGASVARTLAHRARLARLRGDARVATGLLAESLSGASDADDDRLTAALCCLDLAVLCWQRGEHESAARLLGQAEAQHDWRSAPFRADEIADYERAVSALRGALGTERFERLAGEGHAASLELALSEVERLKTAPAIEPKAAAPVPFGLSPRELDVLRQLPKGLSDKEIGDELFISHRTVMRHMTNILTKLDVPTRTAAAAAAVRHGLD